MNAIQMKVHATSKKVSFILKICCSLIVVSTLLLSITALILMFSNSETQQSLLGAFDIVLKSGSGLNLSQQNLLFLFILGIVNLIYMFVILYHAYLIFKSISVELTPFITANVLRIKRIAILVLAFSVFGGISDSIMMQMVAIDYFKFDLNIQAIVIGVVIFCLALIFEYGCGLQKQSDETL